MAIKWYSYIRMSVSSNIKLVRKALKLSQKQFASKISVSSSYLANVESSYRKPNPRLLRLICVTFGVSEKFLTDGKGDMFVNSSDEKVTRLVNMFYELPLEYQNLALEQLDLLLKFKNQKEEK